MLINRAYKFRLLPTKEQDVLLKKHIGCARYAFNWALDTKKTFYEQNKKTLPYAELSRMWTQHKQKNKFLSEVSKWATANALRNVEQAFVNFFRRIKQKQKPGYPKFKNKKYSRQSCTFTNDKKAIALDDDKIKLPVIGLVKIKKHREVVGRIIFATISSQANRWFISITVEREIDIGKNNNPPVGIDVGITQFATLSTGEKIDNPRHLECSLKLLRRRSKQLSRKDKDSKNRDKARTKLAVLHWRIANRRHDFLHKISHRLAKNHGLVVCEDLAVANMMKNFRLARHIADVGWSELYRQLGYKCPVFGSKFQQINRWYPSSKKCNDCGKINHELELSDREWTCTGCGAVHDRDENASNNILAAGCAVTAC